MTDNANEFWQICELCDSNLKFKKFKILEAHRLTHPEYLETVALSDNIKDYCKTECKICGKLYNLSILRAHVKSQHGIRITDYKKIYGLLDLVEKFHHKCKLCGQIILFEADDVKNHLHFKHNMPHHEYNQKYISYRKYPAKKESDWEDITDNKFKEDKQENANTMKRRRKKDKLEPTVDYKIINNLLRKSELKKLSLTKFQLHVDSDAENSYRDQLFSEAYDEIFTLK